MSKSVDEIVDRIAERRAAIPGLLKRQLDLAEESLASPKVEQAYAATVAELAQTEGDIARLEKALEALDVRAKDQERRAQAAATTALRQRIGELLDERSAAASAIESALSQLVEAWRDLIRVSDKVYIAFPNGAPPEGTAFTNTELSALLSRELFRQDRVPVITGRTVAERQTPSLPAPRADHSFFDQPEALPSLTVEIERANGFTRSLLEKHK